MNTLHRRYSPLDRLLIATQKLASLPAPSNLTLEAETPPEFEQQLSATERRKSAALMRVNHAGEIAAQGLYVGQSITAEQDSVRQLLSSAGEEEKQHLQWCQQRLNELNDRPSRLTPLWLGGSIAIGALNGLRGDRWSLGFMAETEYQVEKHLTGHLNKLPADDRRSREIIERMRNDEGGHRAAAAKAGGIALPWPVPQLMKACAKVMTTTARFI